MERLESCAQSDFGPLYVRQYSLFKVAGSIQGAEYQLQVIYALTPPSNSSGPKETSGPSENSQLRFTPVIRECRPSLYLA